MLVQVGNATYVHIYICIYISENKKRQKWKEKKNKKKKNIALLWMEINMYGKGENTHRTLYFGMRSTRRYAQRLLNARSARFGGKRRVAAPRGGGLSRPFFFFLTPRSVSPFFYPEHLPPSLFFQFTHTLPNFSCDVDTCVYTYMFVWKPLRRALHIPTSLASLPNDESFSYSPLPPSSLFYSAPYNAKQPHRLSSDSSWIFFLILFLLR